jgi:hypothetical protein
MISTRQPERSAVAELMDSGEFESPEKLADAVIKLVVALLRERDAYGVACEFLGRNYAIGPFWDLGSAKRKAKELGLPEGSIRQMKAASWLEDGETKVQIRSCPRCGHDWPEHELANRPDWKGCVVGLGRDKSGKINHEGCGCTESKGDHK